jgi:hypothetical protein
MHSFMSTSSRTSSMTHVTSCLNAQQPPQQQQPTSPTQTQSMPVYPQTTKTNEGQMSVENNYEPDENGQRLSSTSSDSSTTSSLTSSSSDEAADKEIEAIVLPTSIQQQNENLESKQLLHNVDLSELLDVHTSQLITDKPQSQASHHHHHQPKENWPNPPSIITASTPSHSKQQLNDQVLAELLQTVRTQHVENEKFKVYQQNQLNTLKLHFDASLQRVNGSGQSSHAYPNDDQLIVKLEKLVKDELKQIVQPQLNKAVEPFKEQIPKEIVDKLQTIENVLKDNITKMFKSKTFMDNITQSLSQSLQSTIVNTYRDTFQKIIIPSFEKSCQNMYQQINQIFKKGI